MLEGQADEVKRWMDEVRNQYGVIPLMLPPVDWNDDLTPWPAGPIFKKRKSFGGKAEDYLNKLENEIIPGVEEPEWLWRNWNISFSLVIIVWFTLKIIANTAQIPEI